jgi:hypothetical protein
VIIEHTLKGSKETSFHNLQLIISNLSIILTNGSYFRNNEEIFKLDSDTVINIPQSAEIMNYEIWITKNGILILARKENEQFAYNQLTDEIDRLCWLSVPANCTNLNLADVHFIKVVE